MESSLPYKKKLAGFASNSRIDYQRLFFPNKITRLRDPEAGVISSFSVDDNVGSRPFATTSYSRRRIRLKDIA